MVMVTSTWHEELSHIVPTHNSNNAWPQRIVHIISFHSHIDKKNEWNKQTNKQSWRMCARVMACQADGMSWRTNYDRPTIYNKLTMQAPHSSDDDYVFAATVGHRNIQRNASRDNKERTLSCACISSRVMSLLFYVWRILALLLILLRESYSAKSSCFVMNRVVPLWGAKKKQLEIFYVQSHESQPAVGVCVWLKTMNGSYE